MNQEPKPKTPLEIEQEKWDAVREGAAIRFSRLGRKAADAEMIERWGASPHPLDQISRDQFSGPGKATAGQDIVRRWEDTPKPRHAGLPGIILGRGRTAEEQGKPSDTITEGAAKQFDFAGIEEANRIARENEGYVPPIVQTNQHQLSRESLLKIDRAERRWRQSEPRHEVGGLVGGVIRNSRRMGHALRWVFEDPSEKRKRRS
jgi:hypothetical protein